LASFSAPDDPSVSQCIKIVSIRSSNLGFSVRYIIELTRTGTSTGPFVGTILAALGISAYLVVAPSEYVAKLMQFTPISTSFKATILGLGALYLLLAWFGEQYIFPGAAKFVGWAKLAISGKPKTRKQYKVIAEKMRF